MQCRSKLTILVITILAIVTWFPIPGRADSPNDFKRLLTTNECKGCKLSGSKLNEANLQNAELQGAELQGADLSSANLMNANLTQAKLDGATLNGTNLKGTHGVTREQLEGIGAKMDSATILPDGSRYKERPGMPNIKP